VRDGKIWFNYSAKHGPVDINDVIVQRGGYGRMDDWLVRYTTNRGIDLSGLIHDDYFLAIELTYNAKLYVSAMKLLVCCIDSLAYIEYGNEPGVFVKWLTAYADLERLGITAEELWELRNGILHMTNINARKVSQRRVRRISFRVGGPADFPRVDQDGIYYFDFYGLIQVFAEAQARWLATYNADRGKFAKFVERYDETISDSRVATTSFVEGAPKD
jgi:hypothetical protein